ncbi:MAG: glycosyltransferase [Candidatus Nanohaloarchaea archaeon]
MRIGFFSDSYFPEIDGVTYTLKLWKERLEERGHEVYIVYPESSDYEPGDMEIPVRSLPNPFYSGYRIPVPVSLDFPELDIVHCHSPAFIGRAGRFYASRNDIPSVYTHHTPLEEYFPQAVHSETLGNLLGKLYVPLEQRFLRKFDVVTSNTDSGRRDVDLEELPVGLDLEFFDRREEKPGGFGENLEEPLAGYSGRISDEKNVEQLVEMAEDFDGTLLIVGEGPRKKKVQRQAGENVVFRDFLDREELPNFYSMLDVFITASTGDTLGLSTLEANACGTPVVAPDVHPFNSTIESGNGMRYPAGDVNALRERTVEAAAQDLDTRKAVEKYSLEKAVDRVEEIYSRLER